MLSNLINTNIPMPNFVAGERPSANKFNSFFSYLNYKLMFVGLAVGDLYGSSSSELPKNRWGRNYFNNDYSTNSIENRQIDIISLANLIGPASNLNPRLILKYGDPSYDIENETIPTGVSEYQLKANYGPVTNVTISNYTRVYTFSTLNQNNEFFYNATTRTIYFYSQTTSTLNVNYTCSFLNNGTNYYGASFNVIPDPNTFQAYSKNEYPQYFLEIALNQQNNTYQVVLPIIGAQQSNIFDNQTGGSSILDSTNPNFQKQIKLPENIISFYNENTTTPIPSNLVVLKCYTTGEIFKDATYYYVDEKTIRIENLNIDPQCLENDDFVLITNGTNITSSIDDLNVKFTKHKHDGSFGDSKISITNIADIFSKQDDQFKYFPSSSIGMNWMPQYLHRNGWSLNADPTNDDNVMRGPLVLNEGVKLFFKKPEDADGSTTPNIVSGLLILLPALLFQTFNHLLFINSNKLITIESFEQGVQILANITSLISLQLKNSGKLIRINDESVLLQHTELVKFKTNQIEYDSYTDNSKIQSVYKTESESHYTKASIAANDGIIKSEYIDLGTTDPIQLNETRFENIENRQYVVVEKENNLIHNVDILNNNPPKTYRLRSEETKTIILNCIPTDTSNVVSDTSAVLPNYLIPFGEVSEGTLLTEKIGNSWKFTNDLYGLAPKDLADILTFQNNLREKLEDNTIPYDTSTNTYRQIYNTNGLKFALIRRGKALSGSRNGQSDSSLLNDSVNENIKILADNIDSTHRDHIISYDELQHGSSLDSITRSDRYELDKADAFYEADLVYMLIKSGINKAYNELTIDDIDTSVEIRYLELRELQSRIHGFGSTSGNNSKAMEDGLVWQLFHDGDNGSDDGSKRAPAGWNQIFRLTKTHWFRESFPIVRINTAKTNIVNIDHAHNVDYVTGSQFVTCWNEYPITTNPYLSKRYGRFISNRLGHLLYRTQMLTAYIDVEHANLSDTSYNYEINFSSQLAALPLSSDPMGTYDYGTFSAKDASMDDHTEGRRINVKYQLGLGAYRYFYSDKSISNSGDNTFLNYDQNVDRVVYEGPAIKLIAKDVDHYVVTATPVAMFNDGQGGLLTFDNTSDYFRHSTIHGNLIPKTYRVGYKAKTKILKCDRYYGNGSALETDFTDEYNGVFFYNPTSAGLIMNNNIPTNTPTSNLAIMTNFRTGTLDVGEQKLQDTTENEFNQEGPDDGPIKSQARRIPAYAALNNYDDLFDYSPNEGNDYYATNICWDSVFLTNTSNLKIKVSIKEEYALDYQTVVEQIPVFGEGGLVNHAENDKENLAIYFGTVGSLNINPQGLKKVRVAYVETNNPVYFKETSHSKVDTFMSSDPSNKQCVPNAFEYTGSNWPSVVGGGERWNLRDVFGRNRYGMINSYKIFAYYQSKYFTDNMFRYPSNSDNETFGS